MRPGEHWLVWRLRQGDRDACRELIRLHHQRVYGYLRRLGADGALAEDLTQETYARAWGQVAKLRQTASLRAWLLAIARNELRQLLRRRRIVEAPLAGIHDPRDPGAGALGAVEWQQNKLRLHRAVDLLEPVLQETVALHYFHELTLREVGAVLGIPPGTVKSRLNRALELLRQVLDRQEANHEPAATRKAAAGRS